MRHIALSVGTTVILVLIGVFVPALSFFGLLLCPLPLAVLGCAQGHNKAAIAELLAEVIIFFAISPYMALYFFLGCAPIAAAVCTITDFKNFSGPESLLICTFASLISKIVLMIVFWFFTGRNVLFPDVSQMENILAQLYGNQPALREAVSQVLVIFPYLIPSLVMIYAGIEAFLNYTLCITCVKKFFKDSKNYPTELPEFISWQFPKSIMFALLLALIMGYFTNAKIWLEGAMFAINLQIILNIFLFIQGLSLVFWFMIRFKFRPLSRFITCIIIVIPFFWPWVIMMGMCDMMLDIRKRIARR